MRDMTHREMIHAVEILAGAGAVIFIAAWIEIARLLSKIEHAIRERKN